MLWKLYFLNKASQYSGIIIVLHPATAAAKSLQSCPILCDPTDSTPGGSPFPGILQARTLEWGAIAFSAYILRATKLFLSVFTTSIPYLPSFILRQYVS